MTTLYRLDLHVHSQYSPDSSLDLGRIMDYLGTAGLQGFALTDHNTVAGHGTLRTLQERYPRCWFIPGVEVSAREGHVLVYGVSEAPRRNLSVEEVAEWAEARGGVTALAHPFRWMHGAGRRVAERARVRCVEGRNGRSSAVANGRAELIAARRGLGTVGGSDAHEPTSVGRSFTEFSSEVDSVDGILDALRRGACAGGGRSLAPWGRVLLALRTSALRAGRGFRPV
ncbi:MAG TPA: PHP domain-containing protein [Thermoplasmata archaeon]|nr:PHP domain-containing protein [Thermoplasmata archaeon]